MFIGNSNAQGTIEYLVILAVVVVISLAVVGFFSGLFSNSSTQISSASDDLGNSVVGGISIVESVVDSDGESLIKLSNNSSESVTITKIKVGDTDNNYNSQVVGLDSKIFSLTDLKDECPCESGQKNVKCNFKIEYTTREGIVKSEYKTINVDCVTDAKSSTDEIVQALDQSPPVVILNYPIESTSSLGVDFNFTANDNSGEISSCVLDINNEKITLSDANNGVNLVHYDFLHDAIIDWNVSCTDASLNSGNSDLVQFNLDSNDYQVTTCLELQDMNQNLSGNYELMNDIDCGTETNSSEGELWNSGAGFAPVGIKEEYCQNEKYDGCAQGDEYSCTYSCAKGSCIANSCPGDWFCEDEKEYCEMEGGTWVPSDPPTEWIYQYSPFNGSLNGNGFNISGLHINLPSTDYVGLIGYASAQSVIKNLSLEDESILGKDYTGGLIGYNEGKVQNSLTSGEVAGNISVGGLIGANTGTVSLISGSSSQVSGSNAIGGLVGYNNYPGEVSASFATGNVTATLVTGGLVGSCYHSKVNSSYATGNVIGGNSPGGLVGVASASSSISNSYALGNVTNNNNYIAGGLVATFSGSSIINSYSAGIVSGHTLGGLVASQFSGGTIVNSFAVGRVNTGTYTAGIIGSSATSNGVTITNSYWDTNLTNQSYCGRYFMASGFNTGCTSTNGNGSGYFGVSGIPFSVLGWDGNWTAVENSYPVLAWQ